MGNGKPQTVCMFKSWSSQLKGNSDFWLSYSFHTAVDGWLLYNTKHTMARFAVITQANMFKPQKWPFKGQAFNFDKNDQQQAWGLNIKILNATIRQLI